MQCQNSPALCCIEMRRAVQGAMSGRLGPGARTIQLSSESPLTFPMAGPGHGISDAIDAAIHTDLPAHPYSGPLPTARSVQRIAFI